ncbi:MAG: DMT family transporter [Pseudomonadota bacterium]
MAPLGSQERDHITLGIILILACNVLMGLGDALVKLISDDLTLWQIFLTRSLIATPLIIGFIYLRRGSFRVVSYKWVLLRSTLLVLTWVAFYASLPVLPLSAAAVAVYTNPIITALLSALWLREAVSRRQWLGVLVGFCGVAVILQPGSDAFSLFILLPLLAATMYSLAMVMTRHKCQDEEATTLALGLHGSFIVAGILGTAVLAVLGLSLSEQATFPFLLGDWAEMQEAAWGIIALMGLLSAAFVVGVAKAYQIAPPHIIGVFDYAYLISAALWGFVLFAEKPGVTTILGMVLITLAGVLVAKR